MDPITLVGGLAGGLWVLDKLGLRTKLAAPRQVDLNACEVDPSGKYRVVRHDLRARVQNALRSLTMCAIVQDTLPIPGWYSLSPLRVQGELDAYTAVGEAVRRGLWVAIRLDSVHDSNGGVLSMGPREEALRLCAGAQPFAILARPREAQQPRKPIVTPPPVGELAKQTSFEDRATVIKAITGSMSPAERAELLSRLSAPAVVPNPHKEEMNGGYVKHSPTPPIEVIDAPGVRTEGTE